MLVMACRVKHLRTQRAKVSGIILNYEASENIVIQARREDARKGKKEAGLILMSSYVCHTYVVLRSRKAGE